MEIKTEIKKDLQGKWYGNTDINMGNALWLTIITKKNRNGALESHATCSIDNGVYLIHRMHRDFNINLLSFNTYPKRLTKKAVIAQHESIDIYSVLEMAESFYKWNK